MNLAHPHSQRLANLLALLDDQNLGYVVISQPQHVFYFTGSMPGSAPAFLIVSSNKKVAVAANVLEGWETILYTSYDIRRGWSTSLNAREALQKALSGFTAPGKTAGVELSHLPALYLPVVQSVGSGLQDLGELLWRLRRIKDETEIAQIQANLTANDQVFAAVQKALRPGVAEYELWGLIYRLKCQAA